MAVKTVTNGNFWRSLGSFGGDPLVCILEIVDNCLDAGARNISIWYSSGATGKVVVSDDGKGMSEDLLLKACNPGESSKVSGSGRYGLGLKSAAASLGRHLEVDSRSAEGSANLRWDIDEDIRTEVFGEGAVLTGSCKRETVGTTVTISRIHSRKMASKSARKDLCKHLTPALRNGVRIIYNGVLLSAYQLYWSDSPTAIEGEARNEKGHLFKYKIGKASDDTVSTDCGWYVYKNHRAVAEYLGVGKGLNESKRTQVLIELIQENHSDESEWQLDAASKSKLSDHNDWMWLSEFVKKKAEAFVIGEADEKESVLIDGLCASICGSFADAFSTHSSGDHGLDEVDGGEDQLAVNRGTRKDKPSGCSTPGGGSHVDGFVANNNGDTHRFSTTVKKNGLTIKPVQLDGLSWSYSHDEESGSLTIYIDKSLVSHAKGSGVHPLRVLAANAMLDWEDDKKSKVCPKSAELEYSRPVRHDALMDALGRKRR